MLSPVEVSARFLARSAKPGMAVASFGPLADQDVVLTVPASFDEEARELTVMAANDAGLPRLTLLEEPAAAFYSWIANNFARSRKLLFDGQIVLVCDVGGGTSDFSLIRVSRDGDKIDFTRTAVGKHLLLGGDNLDLTLAWLVETKLGKQLSIRQRSGLRRQCSAAKEMLLCDPQPQERRNHRARRRIVADRRRAQDRDHARRSARTDARRFSADHAARRNAQGREAQPVPRTGPALRFRPGHQPPSVGFLERAGQAPDAILFNGGFFIPEICRKRVADVLENWYGKRPEIFENRDLDLAVASGAAYYSYVRSTGAACWFAAACRAPTTSASNDSTAVCLVPARRRRRRQRRSRSRRSATGRQQARVVPPASALSPAPTISPAKSFEFADGEETPPARAARSGDSLRQRRRAAGSGEAGRAADGNRHARNLVRFEDQRQPLASAVPASQIGCRADAAPRRPAAVVSHEAVEAACELVRDSFHNPEPFPPKNFPSRLETALGLGRNSWPVDVARRLADVFLEQIENRKRSAAHEVRWLNLGGFCLRPGFGYLGDDYRIEQVRRMYAAGPQFGNQTQNEIDWWIFWGRLAGGLNRNQQVDIVQRLLPFLLPRPGKKAAAHQ